MATLTTRKKGWWKVWLLIGVVAAIVIIIAALALIGFLDLTPADEMWRSVFMWGSDASINGAIIATGFTALGLLGGYLWYNYLRGQQTKTATPTYGGYNPVPTTPSNPQQDTETVIS